jgi:hypothetical protein
MLQENAHIPLINEWLAPGQDDRQVLIAEVMIETFYPFVHSSWLAFTRQLHNAASPCGSRSPSRTARMIACPLIPLMSLNTFANWIFICVSVFCIR